MLMLLDLSHEFQNIGHEQNPSVNIKQPLLGVKAGLPGRAKDNMGVETKGLTVDPPFKWPAMGKRHTRERVFYQVSSQRNLHFFVPTMCKART